ncbi:putative serine/threonine-protein kinase PBL20 [Bidens hawaiensis]|uniref:putative serine/threonine-protein kinase PBL20 n=1 Tax=Bidens hawaiensis TaxID=980011 RepID=UPI00404B0CE3
MLQMESMEHRLQIAFKDIKLATRDFNKSCHIGDGGFGDVYKAELKIRSKYTLAETPCTVAIKRIKRRIDGDGKTGFDAEINVLSKREHQNIVSLQGYCEEGDEMLLVYEYATNRSLDSHLRERTYNFKWAQRLKMCIDIAQGLEYLHTTREVRTGRPRLLILGSLKFTRGIKEGAPSIQMLLEQIFTRIQNTLGQAG